MAWLTGGSSAKRADVVDFKIIGDDSQFVEIELDPGESAVAEAGAMMYKDPVIDMQTVFGDGSEQPGGGGGFFGKLLGAGKRLITGESMFTTVYTHQGSSGKAHVAFAAPYSGSILPVDLTDVGGTLICQRDAFLAAAKGVSIGLYFQKKIMVGLFGGEGFIMQKLEGDGLVFVHAGGTIVRRDLAAGESLHVDTGCLVAMTSGVNFELQTVRGVKSWLFGGEGVFFADLSGPGTVWLQSLPISRMAARILAAAPQTGSGVTSGGTGAVVAGSVIGSLFDN